MMADMDKKMPVLFIGHGSPMNAIEDNEYTKKWEAIAEKIPRPKAILAVSAHWYTDGGRINDEAHPRVIYDMYGFPEELYKLKYSSPGAPERAHETKKLIKKDIKIDNSWGIDHGTWSVLCRMYPEANIPVYQLSVDKNAPAEEHYRIGQEIKELRQNGVLILGSGNVVHNLGRVNWDNKGGYDWAEEFDGYVKDNLIKREIDEVIHYERAGTSARLAVPTPDHFYPLLYTLGAADGEDKLTVFNNSCVLGSLSMTCYMFE